MFHRMFRRNLGMGQVMFHLQFPQNLIGHQIKGVRTLAEEAGVVQVPLKELKDNNSYLHHACTFCYELTPVTTNELLQSVKWFCHHTITYSAHYLRIAVYTVTVCTHSGTQV